MTEEELQEIINRYQKKPETEYEAAWKIFSFLYFKPYFFIPPTISVDTKNDFLVYFYPKIKRFLSQYCKDKGPAQVYLHYFVGGYFKNFLGKSRTEERKLMLIHNDISAQEVRASIADMVFDSAIEANAVAETTPTEPFSAKKIACINKTDQKKLRQILLILSLKSCISIDDSTISLVARYTKMNYKEIQEKVEAAKESIVSRQKRNHKKQLIRNEYYIKKKLKQTQTPITTELKNEIENIEKRIETITNSIKNISLTPTNRYIAKSIGVSFTTVNRYMTFLRTKESARFFNKLRDTINP